MKNYYSKLKKREYYKNSGTHYGMSCQDYKDLMLYCGRNKCLYVINYAFKDSPMTEVRNEMLSYLESNFHDLCLRAKCNTYRVGDGINLCINTIRDMNEQDYNSYVLNDNAMRNVLSELSINEHLIKPKRDLFVIPYDYLERKAYELDDMPDYRREYRVEYNPKINAILYW